MAVLQEIWLYRAIFCQYTKTALDLKYPTNKAFLVSGNKSAQSPILRLLSFYRKQHF